MTKTVESPTLIGPLPALPPRAVVLANVSGESSCQDTIQRKLNPNGSRSGKRSEHFVPRTFLVTKNSTHWTCFPIPVVMDCMWATRKVTPRQTLFVVSIACADMTCCTRWASMRSDFRPKSMPSRRTHLPECRPKRISIHSDANSRCLVSAMTGTASCQRPMSITSVGRNGLCW